MAGKIIQKGILYLLCLILSGCTAIAPTPQSQPPTQPPPSAPEVKKEKKEQAEAKPRPRELASLHLTDQGRILLEKGKYDDAISVLERAVSLSASNGKNYYYLAEAWLRKGNGTQAREWNRLAEMYLAGDQEWLRRVHNQRERIAVRIH
ncbi:MAG: tetratricopeptide repeat protein [Syntrophaceae bacterium]